MCRSSTRKQHPKNHTIMTLMGVACIARDKSMTARTTELRLRVSICKLVSVLVASFPGRENPTNYVLFLPSSACVKCRGPHKKCVPWVKAQKCKIILAKANGEFEIDCQINSRFHE